MKIEIGSYEAKTKLPELIRGVQQGQSYTITLRGEAVAQLVPPDVAKPAAISAAVAQMRSFIANHPSIHGIDTKALIEQGRD